VARRFLAVLLLAFLVAAPAAADNASRKQRVDQRIDTLNGKIAAAREQERRLHAEIANVSSRIRTLENQVGDVNSDLQALEQDLALQREKLAKITELWHVQTRKLIFLRQQHAEAVDRLSDRLVAIYESGNPSTVDVLMSSASFSDVISRLDYVRELASQDRRIAASVGLARNRITAQRARTTVIRRRIFTVTRTVAIRTEQTRRVRNQLVSKEQALAGARGQKQHALGAVQETKADYLHEVEGLLAVSAQLSSRIQASQTSSSVTPSASGFIWPVSGPVTSSFGWRWGRMHEGVDIAVPSGTPVHAAKSGQVIYAGWMGGYGNLVVIDHGGGIATAYGHNTSVVYGSGTAVSQGQVVAYSGSTGHSTGPHVHFEVRVNGSAVDPLGYLG